MGKMMMMQMYFYWGCSVTLLFSGWTIKDGETGKFLGSCAVVVLFGFVSQALKSIKHRSFSRKAQVGYYPLLAIVTLIQAFIYLVDAFCMLLLMTYNWGIVLSVILGQTVGFLVFNATLEISTVLIETRNNRVQISSKHSKGRIPINPDKENLTVENELHTNCELKNESYSYVSPVEL